MLKFLKRQYLLFILLVVGTACQLCWASPWLEKPGQFKPSITIMSSDGNSAQARGVRQIQYQEAKGVIYKLEQAIKEIDHLVIDEDRELEESEAIKIQSLQDEINLLTTEADLLDAFNQEAFYKIDLETGINSKHSIGINFNLEQCQELNQGSSSKNHYGFYHKYNFYNRDSFVHTIESSIQFASHKDDWHGSFLGVAIKSGYSTSHHSHKEYYSTSFAIRQYLHKKSFRHPGFIFSFNQGVEIKNGFYWDNYTEYQYVKNPKAVYNNIVYLQSSIHKRISWRNSYQLNFQIGYFWKKSTLNKNYYISGPILSLWMSA